MPTTPSRSAPARPPTLLAELTDDADLLAGNDDSFFAAPASEDALATLCAHHPDATIVGGATDVGLWITKQLRELPRIVHTGRVASLHRVREFDDRLEIGAAATYAEAEEALRQLDPDVGEMLRRLGSKQVRSTGTVGGNIANGSPIGDSPPVLIALGASIELRHRDTRRTMALEDFFLDYGRQDRAPGEILTRITVPKLGDGEHFRCYKISKRFDQDISALLGAFRFRIRREPDQRGAHRLRRDGRDPQTRPGNRAGRRRLALARPSFLVRGRGSPRRGLLAHRRPPRQRAVPHARSAVAAAESARRNHRASHDADAHHRFSGTGARQSHGPDGSA